MKDSPFVLADTHLGHKNIHHFRLKPDGTRFESADEHDEFVIEKINEVVTPRSKAIYLGDVAFNERGLKKLDRINGDKVLVQGNHDLAYETMRKYAGKVCAMVEARVFDTPVILTHIPILLGPDHRWKLNIHGHTHDKTAGTPRHLCVSLEAIGFVPITLEQAVLLSVESCVPTHA